MIKEIITYPTPPSVEYATDVRKFDNNLFALIDDLKDTINANKLKGLAAYQIGSYFNVIVVRQNDGTFLELINPRLISVSDKITTQETTAYFKDISAQVQRHKDISLIYQDRNAKDNTLLASDEFAILLQRKIDYTFGSTFLNKLSKKEKKIFEQKLEFGVNVAIPESCPIVSYKDYILKFINILTILIAILLFSSFFISETTTLVKVWDYQLYISYLTLLSSFIYIIYGVFEGKRFSRCTSCQIGNMLGTLAIIWIKLIIIMFLSYLLII